MNDHVICTTEAGGGRNAATDRPGSNIASLEDRRLRNPVHHASGQREAARLRQLRRARASFGLLAVLPMLLLPHAALARDAQKIIQDLCIACHTLDGNAVVPAFPKLAGLHAEYLEKQLIDYAAGDRQHETMQAFAEDLSRNEMQALAAHFSDQSRHDGVVTQPELLDEGRRVYHEGDRERGVPACAGCHKPDGSGTPRSVMIAGQNAPYVAEQLTLFKNDVRTNDRGRLMRTVAGRMTQAEIQAVAQYVASMR